jgi:hypothetical protein
MTVVFIAKFLLLLLNNGGRKRKEEEIVKDVLEFIFFLFDLFVFSQEVISNLKRWYLIYLGIFFFLEKIIVLGAEFFIELVLEDVLFFLQTCKFITFTIKKKDLPLPDW